MRFIGIVLFLLLYCFTSAQKDSTASVTVPLLGIHVSGQVPFGDLASRFGPALGTGASLTVKTRHNWVYGVDAFYFFGRNVREDVMKNLRNDDGFVVDNEGYPADIRITERGACIHIVGGKVLNFLSANRHSGLLLLVGAGAMQHKVKLYDPNQNIAAIRGELAEGYDRLSIGFSLSQFVGYLFLSEHRMVNFYAGFEFCEGFTRSVRKFNYDTATPDTAPRLDGIAGFRFGWILPLYKKKPDDFYFY